MVCRPRLSLVVWCLAWALLTGSARAQDVAEQIRQLQEADRQRQLELEQLKTLNQALLEKLESKDGPAKAEEDKPADADASEDIQYGEVMGAPAVPAAAKKPVVHAGYTRLGGVSSRNDGFFIQNDDGTFLLRIHNRMQFRYAYDHFYDDRTRNGVPSFDRHEDRSDFHFAREYLTFNGNAWSKDLFYQLTLEAFTAAPSNEAFRLRYMWTDYNVLHGLGWADDTCSWRNVLNLRAGLWKGWFGREFPASDGQLQLVDRALATQAFNEGRIRGVGLFGSFIYFADDREEDGKIRGQGRLAYFFEVGDSINNAGQAFNLDTALGPNPFGATPAPPVRAVDSIPAFTARLQYDFLRGFYTYVLPDGKVVRANDFRFDEEDDLAYHEEPALQGGVSYVFQQDDFDGQPADNYLMGRYFKGKNIQRFGADLAFKYRGYSLTGEYYKEDIDPRGQLNNFGTGVPFTAAQRQGQTSSGFYVRGGFFLWPKRVELCGRVSGLFADDIPFFGPTGNGNFVRFVPMADAWEYTLGLTYYPTGHHYLKLQVDGTYLQNSPISAEKSEFTSGSHENDLIGRVQLQVEF